MRQEYLVARYSSTNLVPTSKFRYSCSKSGNVTDSFVLNLVLVRGRCTASWPSDGTGGRDRQDGTEAES
eukprot:SAG31_NODE_1709_length_7476_cov_25.181254_2_plen_69_part_00